MVKWRNSNINFFVHKHFLPKKLHSDVTIDLQGSQTSCDITILSIDTVHGGSRREQSYFVQFVITWVMIRGTRVQCTLPEFVPALISDVEIKWAVCTK